MGGRCAGKKEAMREEKEAVWKCDLYVKMASEQNSSPLVSYAEILVSHHRTDEQSSGRGAERAHVRLKREEHKRGEGCEENTGIVRIHIVLYSKGRFREIPIH